MKLFSLLNELTTTGRVPHGLVTELQNNWQSSYLYTEVDAVKQALISLGMRAPEKKGEYAPAIAACVEAQKNIEHEIWVSSRECAEADAATLVNEIPDHIILNLSKAPLHDGKPRTLLQTRAFQERLKILQ